jgi:hypothetical protein
VMKKHKFTLVLSGVSEITPELADALYEATGGDIEFNMCNGVAVLEMERAGPSLREAIVTAIGEVEAVRDNVRVVRVESDIANMIAKINAALLGSVSEMAK